LTKNTGLQSLDPAIVFVALQLVPCDCLGLL